MTTDQPRHADAQRRHDEPEELRDLRGALAAIKHLAGATFHITPANRLEAIRAVLADYDAEAMLKPAPDTSWLRTEKSGPM